ncbi:sensor histidine kinase [Streptomyces sp. DT24]|uniref:sensor histidine kinase n=1 Tax=Streptomyces sp. DT24 TaxID=3416520 RepID=UPI003CF5FDDA
MYAFLGAGLSGLAGGLALWRLRRRSVVVALNVVAAVAVGAMLTGTLVVAHAMFLSSRDLWVVTVVVGMAAVVAFPTAVLLGRWVVARTRELEAAAESLVSGRGFVVPGGARTAELDSLSTRLASVSAQLAASREREQTLEASRRELVAWISHDLKTPLAGLRAMSEALEDGVVANPGRYYRQIGTEVERLNHMVDDLFQFSRIHSGALALTCTRLSVHDLVGEALAGADPLARKNEVRLVDAGIQAIPVEVDGKEVLRVFTNLLVNAIHHTPVDGTVAVAAERRAESVVVSVTDGCGGIPAEHLPHVFEMGWRGTAARTPSTGAGVGLAIVRGIVEAHAGRVNVRNVQGGCRFEVTLPTGAA